MLLILQKIITYEGRFKCMYVYHIHLLMNFLDNGNTNPPFFLLNSLRRMASNVKKKIEFLETTMYHHGLAKILVEYHLNKIRDTWENFLIRNHFWETPKSPEKYSVRKSRKKKTNLTIQSNPEPSVQKKWWRRTNLWKINRDQKSNQAEEEDKTESWWNSWEHTWISITTRWWTTNLWKMTDIKRQIKGNENIGKEKKGAKEENIKPLRRSSRLKGMVNKVSSKETEFINLEGETPVSSP